MLFLQKYVCLLYNSFSNLFLHTKSLTDLEPKSRILTHFCEHLCYTLYIWKDYTRYYVILALLSRAIVSILFVRGYHARRYLLV